PRPDDRRQDPARCGDAGDEPRGDREDRPLLQAVRRRARASARRVGGAPGVLRRVHLRSARAARGERAMARIPYLDPAKASERVPETLAQLPAPLNVFRMMAHAETLFPHWVRLGGAILGRAKLSPRLRELVILRVARLSKCDYEWTQHVPIAKACGITDE